MHNINTAKEIIDQAVKHIRIEAGHYESTTSLCFAVWKDQCAPEKWLENSVKRQLGLNK